MSRPGARQLTGRPPVTYSIDRHELINRTVTGWSRTLLPSRLAMPVPPVRPLVGPASAPVPTSKRSQESLRAAGLRSCFCCPSLGIGSGWTVDRLVPNPEAADVAPRYATPFPAARPKSPAHFPEGLSSRRHSPLWTDGRAPAPLAGRSGRTSSKPRCRRQTATCNG